MIIEIKERPSRLRCGLCALAFAFAFILVFYLYGRSDAIPREPIARTASLYDAASADGEFERLLDEFYSLLPSEMEADISSVSFDKLMLLISSALTDGVGGAVSELSTMLGVCLLLTLCEGGLVKGALGELSSAGAMGILSIPLSASLFSVANTVGNAIEAGCDFFGGMIPIATAATALSGAGTSAAAEAAGMSLALGFVSNMLLENLIPTVALMLAFSMASAFDTGGIVGSLGSSLKGILLFVMGFISFLLPATLSFQSVISSAKDSMALRSAKYAVGNMIPIVGGAISSMLSTLISGATLAKSTVGALSSVAIGVIFAAPLVSLILLRLAYKITVCFLEFVGVSLGKRVFSSLMGALDAMIAMLCMSGAIFFLESVIFMRSVVSL